MYGTQVYVAELADEPKCRAYVYAQGVPQDVGEEYFDHGMRCARDQQELTLTPRIEQFVGLSLAEMKGIASSCATYASMPQFVDGGDFEVQLIPGRGAIGMSGRYSWMHRLLGVRVFTSVARQDVANGAPLRCICTRVPSSGN